MRAQRRPLAAVRRRLIATARIWSRGDAHMAMLASPSVLPPAGSLDRPAPGTVVPRSFVHVDGWAVTASGPCARVELTVDGRTVGRARLGDVRLDIELATGLPTARLTGFHDVIDLSDIASEVDWVELAGYGVGLDGVRVTFPPVRLRMADRAPDQAPEDRPQVHPSLPESRHRLPRSPSGHGERGLRLLVGTHDLNYGGAQLFLTDLLRSIGGASSIEGVVVAPSDGPTRGTLEALGLRVHLTTPFPIDSGSAYEDRMEELLTWTATEQFDVAFINTMSAYPAGDLAWRLGLPTVWAIHESYPLPSFWTTAHGDDLDPAVKVRGAAALGASAVRAFTCEATRHLYEPYLGGARCVTLPYGVDVAALDQWRAGFDRVQARAGAGIADDATVILCMGTIEPRKAQTQLVHAFARIADRHPQALLLFVGGREDHYTGAVRHAITHCGLEHRAWIQPIVPDPRPSYATADLMVSASDVESTPRSMLEAMAVGLPVLSTNVFGVPELITDGQTGWLMEPRDVTALAEGLERVLSLDERARLDVADNARRMVESTYRLDVCSEQWAQLLRESIRANASAAKTAKAGGAQQA